MVAKQTTPITPGHYEAKIVRSQMVATADGNRLDLNFEIIGGEHDGGTIVKQLHLHSRNANTQWRDRQDLCHICRAVAVLTPHDSSELHNIPMVIQVGVDKRRNTILAYASARRQSAAEPPKSRRLQLTRADQIEIRPPDWLLRGMIERDTFALIFGDPGCGKSFLAIDWACRIATGTPWRGQAVKGGPVVYVAGEGQNGFGRRIRAWSEHHGITLAEVPLYLAPAVAIPDPTDLVALITAIDTGVANVGQPTLIVLDTLARCYGGGDESSTQDMSRFVAACDAIRNRYNCTILVVHHSGHADKTRARGAMALKAALDAEYRLAGDNGLRLTSTKMKDAETPPPLAMELVTVELPGLVDDYGNPVTSAAIDVVDADTGALESQAKAALSGKRGKWQRLGLKIAKRLIADNDGGEVAIESWRDECLRAGMVRQNQHRVMQALLERGEIIVAGESMSLPTA
ncbi:MAG: AAA family ATPase [Phycisphaera sp.]|nr:AAA family ATPase [Phycisphaera sp.]